MTETEWENLRAFHGHLGPWLILGLKMGRAALTALKARKHFGVEVLARCPDSPPPSCLVDGLQLGTGATYGKRNIVLEPSDRFEVVVRNKDTGEAVRAAILPAVPDQFRSWYEEMGEEACSRRVAEMPDEQLFTLESVA